MNWEFINLIYAIPNITHFDSVAHIYGVVVKAVDIKTDCGPDLGWVQILLFN